MSLFSRVGNLRNGICNISTYLLHPVTIDHNNCENTCFNSLHWHFLEVKINCSHIFKVMAPCQEPHNPLRPDITMHIPLTVLYTFLMELVRRICLNMKTSYPWWSLLLFSSFDIWTNSDNVKRNFIFVTVGALRVNREWDSAYCSCYIGFYYKTFSQGWIWETTYIIINNVQEK